MNLFVPVPLDAFQDNGLPGLARNNIYELYDHWIHLSPLVASFAIEPHTRDVREENAVSSLLGGTDLILPCGFESLMTSLRCAA